MLADFSKPNVVMVEKPPNLMIREEFSVESYLSELDSLQKKLPEMKNRFLWNVSGAFCFLSDKEIFVESKKFELIAEEFDEISKMILLARQPPKIKISFGQQELPLSLLEEAEDSEEKYMEDNLKEIYISFNDLKRKIDSFEKLILNKKEGSALVRELLDSILLSFNPLKPGERFL